MDIARPVSALVSLDDVVNYYMSQHDIPDGKFDKVSNIAIRGFRLFHRDSTGIPVDLVLPVQANNTSVLPVDAMTNLGVSVLNQRGGKASLVYDQLLSFTQAESTERVDQPVDDLLVNNEVIINSFNDNGIYPNLGYGQYGIGSTGVIGYYNIDWGQRLIVYNFHFNQTEVIFSYLAAPNCQDGNFLVDEVYMEALIAFINWQYSVGDKKSGPTERSQNKRDFDIQYANARRAAVPFDPSVVYNQYRQSLRLAVKV